jgi:hypothetical protein
MIGSVLRSRLSHPFTGTFMFVKELHRAGHTKRFSIEQQGGDGWDVRLEQDNRVLKQMRYTDWHRVERALTKFAMEIGELEELGWRG